MTRPPIRTLAVVALAMLAIGACTATPGGPAATTSSTSAAASASAAASKPACPTSQPPALAAGQTRTVTIDTALGSMTLKIEADLSPIAAGNFVALAGCGYYDGVVFHRVVPRFVIQGGDPSGSGSGGPGYTIKDEPVTAKYGRGVVAMARTMDPDSVGSQFFIVLDDSARDILASYNTYQIIGHVTAGMETADAITQAAQGVELPTKPVVMTNVTVSNP
jgi:peptidyl-prolyl cis-trans isomerase B (cyclophilin B)